MIAAAMQNSPVVPIVIVLRTLPLSYIIVDVLTICNYRSAKDSTF